MDQEQTWIQLVRDNWPGISDEDADMVLWNATCFPFGTEAQVTKHIQEKCVQSNGDPVTAVDIAHRELDEAMRRHNLEHPQNSNF
jgi:hypothetical protein